MFLMKYLLTALILSCSTSYALEEKARPKPSRPIVYNSDRIILKSHNPLNKKEMSVILFLIQANSKVNHESIHYGDVVAIMDADTGKFLTVGKDANFTTIPQSETIKKNNLFTIQCKGKNNGNFVQLRDKHVNFCYKGKYYLSLQPDGSLQTNRPWHRSWEVFSIKRSSVI